MATLKEMLADFGLTEEQFNKMKPKNQETLIHAMYEDRKKKSLLGVYKL